MTGAIKKVTFGSPLKFDKKFVLQLRLLTGHVI